jgi:hypothetical protein
MGSHIRACQNQTMRVEIIHEGVVNTLLSVIFTRICDKIAFVCVENRTLRVEILLYM